jgi:hypothetical protein
MKDRNGIVRSRVAGYGSSRCSAARLWLTVADKNLL